MMWQMAELVDAAHSIFTSDKTDYGLPSRRQTADYYYTGEGPTLDELIIRVYKDPDHFSDGAGLSREVTEETARVEIACSVRTVCSDSTQ